VDRAVVQDEQELAFRKMLQLRTIQPTLLVTQCLVLHHVVNLLWYVRWNRKE
jgi:hypothetical protein